MACVKPLVSAVILRPNEDSIEVFGQLGSSAHPRLLLEAVVSNPHSRPNAVEVRSAYGRSDLARMRTRTSGGERGVRSNAAPISILVISLFESATGLQNRTTKTLPTGIAHLVESGVE